MNFGDVATIATGGISALIMCAALVELEEDEYPSFCADDLDSMLLDEVKRSNKRHRSGDDGDDCEHRKKIMVRYNRERALANVQEDYFGPDPIFHDRQFERVFRISTTKAQFILNRIASSDPFWTQTWDATKRMSNAPQVKLLASLKMACYGESFSAWQDYYQMGESTARLCLSKLCRGVVNDPVIRGLYLRNMTKEDARRIEQLHFEKHGVHGCIGSLDVNQIGWENCPAEQKGQHVGRSGKPTLALEAWIDTNLWIWHWYFGEPGSLNDVNVLERSTLWEQMTHGRMNEIDFEYTINGETFSQLWFFVDLIYPMLSRFLRAVSVPTNRVDCNFTPWHHFHRKDVERGFGVWEKKYHSVKHPIRMFKVDDMYYLVGATIAMHNMMVQVRLERNEEESASWYDLVSDYQSDFRPPEVVTTPAALEAIAREDHHFQQNAELADLDNAVVDLDFRHGMEQSNRLTRNMRYVQYYWSELNNVQEHVRLQRAVKRQLYYEVHGSYSRSEDLGSFDPLEGFILTGGV